MKLLVISAIWKLYIFLIKDPGHSDILKSATAQIGAHFDRLYITAKIRLSSFS